MGRKVRFTPDQVRAIREDPKQTDQQLAFDYGTTRLTINKVRNFKGAYKKSALDLGEPVLSSSGLIIGVVAA